MEDNNKYMWKGKRGFFFAFFIIATFALAGVVMFLWNSILPNVAHVSIITYWQAMGLLILCRILFGNYRFGRHQQNRPPFANQQFRQKFMNMTDEERTAFKQKWKERCAK